MEIAQQPYSDKLTKMNRRLQIFALLHMTPSKSSLHGFRVQRATNTTPFSSRNIARPLPPRQHQDDETPEPSQVMQLLLVTGRINQATKVTHSESPARQDEDNKTGWPTQSYAIMQIKPLAVTALAATETKSYHNGRYEAERLRRDVDDG